MRHLPAHNVPVDFVPCESRFKIDTGLWNCFEAVSNAWPDKLAMDDGLSQLTYGECLQTAIRLSSRLQDLALANDQTSIILLDTSINSALTTLAHIRAGIVFVPIDAAISANRIGALVESCRPAAIVTESRYAGLVQEFLNGRHLILVDQVEDVKSGDEIPPPSEREEVCRMLTSGSSGMPKQIIYTQKMILHDVYVRSDSLKISPSDRFCQWIGGTSLPLMTLFLCVLNGSSLHIHDIHRQGLKRLTNWISKNRITILRLTPTLLRLFMKQSPGEKDLSSVRLVSTGGETLRSADVDRFKRVFPPETVLLNHLSATEYRVACQYFIDAERQTTDLQIPVGFPVKDVEVEIVDGRGNSLPDGEIGQIAIRSAFISPGFVQPGSGETIEHDMTPCGFYLTGDLGLRRADQCIEHHGRKDRMAKIRGIRIELDEVESVLSRLDGAEKAATLLMTSPDSEPVLVACIVEEVGSSVSLRRLRQALYAELGLFGLPHHLEKRATLPMTSNGKIDRVELQNELQCLFERCDDQGK